MEIYLILYFRDTSSEPTIVKDKLEKIGFKGLKGHYDLLYYDEGEKSIDDIMKIGDQVQEALADDNVLFKITSFSGE